MFTKDKAIHSLEVANFMRGRAEMLGLNPDDAWLIGYTHDIGYLYGSTKHGDTGCKIASKFSETLGKYIASHDKFEPIKDNMEFLLRLADFVVDETGRYVGMIECMNSILRRRPNMSKEKLMQFIKYIEEYAEENNLKHIIENCF
jgi:putative nucleotidyltransferase with HDIG domain